MTEYQRKGGENVNDEYVKLADLENFAKIAKTMGMPLEKSAENLLDFARNKSTNNIVEVIRCRDCARRSEHEKLGHVCVNKDTKSGFIFYKPINLDGFCSDAFPIKPKI